MNKRKYNWIEDAHDPRDWRYAVAPRTSETSKIVPKKIDLRAGCSPVEDQGSIGSCTANALSGALEFLGRKNAAFFEVSRLFIYYNERVLQGTTMQDSGATL